MYKVNYIKIKFLLDLFNAKNILVQEQQYYYLTQSWSYKRVNTLFPRVFVQREPNLHLLRGCRPAF